jgi:hypothetical protein
MYGYGASGFGDSTLCRALFPEKDGIEFALAAFIPSKGELRPAVERG